MPNSPTDCSQFDSCPANLCPLDPGLDRRTWYVGEDVCVSRSHGQARWIRKQRQLNRKKPKTWCDRPITYQELYEASRPRVISDEQRQATAERLGRYRFQKATRTAEGTFLCGC
ncbi:MAG: hypothetical protein HQK56_06535 [Deltaproteobacteria bacterium]|nr:hypothetical protein [Deltaproteobacteria bacterium]